MLSKTNALPLSGSLSPSRKCMKTWSTQRFILVRCIARLMITLSMCLLGPHAQANPATPDPLSLIKGLSATQINTLHNAGIDSLAVLSTSKPELIAQTIKVDKKQASTIINQATLERTRLGKSLVSASSRFKLPTITVPGSYASLIAPTNGCTLLVRKVCGLENQCSSSTGCAPAMTLLQRFNDAATELDRVAVSESCLMARQDELLFWQCEP